MLKHVNSLHKYSFYLVQLKKLKSSITDLLYYLELNHCRNSEKFKDTTWFWGQNTLTSSYWKETVVPHWDDGVQATTKFRPTGCITSQRNSMQLLSGAPWSWEFTTNTALGNSVSSWETAETSCFSVTPRYYQNARK